MKLSYFYDQIIRCGREADPRKNIPARSAPYADTALLYGNPDTEIRKLMVGIDIEVPEILLADKLRKKRGLDLVLAHHPEGRAWAALHRVMLMQADMLADLGIPAKVAPGMIEERVYEVERRLMPHNHMRAVDAARLLDIPLVCAHTPADNHAFTFVKRLMEKEKPRTVQDIVDILWEIPEYKYAAKENAGPCIIAGSPRRPAGKVFVEMTGGTEGPVNVYEKISQAGVRTLVSMHLSEEHFKKVKDANLNVIIAGHISSDTLGVNLLLDKIERSERLETIDCSGFRRVRRTKILSGKI